MPEETPAPLKMFFVRGVLFFFVIFVSATRIHTLRPNSPLRVGELWCDRKYPLTLAGCMQVEYDQVQNLCQVTYGLQKERFMAVPLTNASDCNLSLEVHWDKRWHYTFCVGSSSCLPYANTFYSVGSAIIKYYTPEEWYSGFWITIMDSDGISVSKSIKL